jgi:tellurite resistance protein
MSKTEKPVSPRITRQVLRIKDRTLLEGAMATAALVALADHRLSIEESIAIKGVLESARLLKIYDPNLALTLYTRHVDALRDDPAAGKQAALEAVALCADDMDAAELVIHVGVAIAKADRIFKQVELEAIEEICETVGISGLDTLALAGVDAAKPH